MLCDRYLISLESASTVGQTGGTARGRTGPTESLDAPADPLDPAGLNGRHCYVSCVHLLSVSLRTQAMIA